MKRERRQDYPQITEYIKKNGSDLVTLKEFFNEKFALQDKALELARESLNIRLENMNNLRDQINKIEGTLITRKELDLILDRINKDKRADIATWLAIGSLVVSILFQLLK